MIYPTMSRTQPRNERGFTLVELMIVIAIIGILATVAVPQYGQYSKRSKFTEVISTATNAKISMATCLQTTHTLDKCDTWKKLGIDVNTMTRPSTIQTAVINTSPVVIVFTANQQLNSATYQLTPSYDPTSSTILWQTGGTCSAPETRYC